VAIEPPTMVRTIDRMVRDGLVERRADPRDARVSRIHLTARGLDLRDELVPKAVAVNERTRRRLSPGDQRSLLRSLKTLGQPD
jgi:DNA-binding MarR family transcriptional regulator